MFRPLPDKLDSLVRDMPYVPETMAARKLMSIFLQQKKSLVSFQFLKTNFSFLNDYISYVPVETVFMYLAPISLAIGVGIGFFGSFFTVRKHLHV